MPLLPAKCPICGAILNIESEKEAALCPCCNNAFVVEKAINNYNTFNTIKADTVVVNNESEKEQLNKNGEFYIKLGFFEEAIQYYKQLVNKLPDDYRGWWGWIRCKYLKNDLNKIPYVCTKCGFSVDEWHEKCPSCNERNALTRTRKTIQRQHMGEIKRILCILEKLAPSEAYVEYKGMVDQFLHVQAQENAIEAAAQRRTTASNMKKELEKQVIAARANVESLKERVNSEDSRIDESKQQYAYKTELINRRKIVDAGGFKLYDNPIVVYNSYVNMVNQAQSTYEQADKKMLPYIVLLGIGIAFAVLGIFAAESFILAIIFLWLYWWLGNLSRSKYKEAKKRLANANAKLLESADKAKEKLKEQYENAIAGIRKESEKSRKDIEQGEKEIALYEGKIQTCEKLLNFSDTEIQKFYLSLWHKWFELESVSYDERLNELLSPERIN